jgi:signal transduction histidine kinase
LLANLYLWRIDGRTPRLLLLDRQSFRFQEKPWPSHLERLREYLNEHYWELAWITEREAYRHRWILHEPTPALVQALFYVSPGERSPAAEAQHLGFLILELDRGRLTSDYLPALAARHFGPLQQTSFLIAVRAAGRQGETLFQSDPGSPVSLQKPDAETDLLNPEQDRWEEPVGGSLTPSHPQTRWRLAVQHRAGSLAAAVASLRRRNLIISFSLLSLLAASVALILVLARRTQRLAALQMEFVAGVSHELRSPLSVICAAADNLAEGVVSGPERSRQYGDLIRTEGRRLSRMVEQALLFAAEQADRIRFNLQPVQAADVVEAALKAAAPSLRQAAMQVEKSVPPDLPLVLADANALNQCLENLIANAVKYAHSGGWLGVRASVSGAEPQREVEIVVEDRGPGIAHADLSHIFEPFYRAKHARESQVKGAGLGLYLVRRMMEGMGGRVSSWSRPGRGARFTLHLPVACAESPEQSQPGG